jgi:uncharacterized protein (DUF1800 family)
MTDRREMSHVLRRVMFGPTSTEVEAALRSSVQQIVTKALTPATPINLPDIGPEPQVTAKSDKTARQQARQAQQKQVAAALDWWLGRMAADTTGAEKLVFFWHGHWATSVQKVRSAHLMLGQQQTFRRYGPGDTGAFVRAMLRDPALIIWLDGQKNTRKAPNENLARELMELFTLGVGHYTEDDVKAAARVLTGWVVDKTTGRATLKPARHDDGTVTLLGRTGSFDVDSYADLLTRNDHHLPFLASRLWVRYGSGAAPSAAATSRIVAAGRSGNALLTAVLTDPEFPATNGQLVKQPIEWLIGAVRQLGLDVTEVKAPAVLKSLGQVPFRPPSVGGWPVGDAWLTTSSTEARIRTGQALAAMAKEATDRLTGTDRLEALADLLVIDGWSDRTKAALSGIKDPRRLLALGLASPEYAVH